GRASGGCRSRRCGCPWIPFPSMSISEVAVEGRGDAVDPAALRLIDVAVGRVVVRRRLVAGAALLPVADLVVVAADHFAEEVGGRAGAAGWSVADDILDMSVR